MKVLHVIETLGRGGAEQLLLTLLPELRRNGADVSVAVLREPLSLLEDMRAIGIEVHQLPGQTKWNVSAGARAVANIARECECDIVHAHLFFPALYTALARLMIIRDVKTCVTFHNLAYMPGVNPAGPRLWLRRQLARAVYPWGIDCSLAVSQPVAKHYGEVLRLKDIIVLHNPVDLEQIDRLAAATNARNNDSSRVRLVLPGRLVHEKGHIDFLDALVLLRSRGLVVAAKLAGGGPMQEQIKAEIAVRSLDDQVVVTGELPHHSLLETVADADIVVVPSRFEGFGLTALEAMGLSKPVIASRVGGLVEVVANEKTGTLVTSRSPAELADSISRLVSDPELRKRFGMEGRRRAEEKFSLPKIAAELEQIYSKLLLSSGP